MLVRSCYFFESQLESTTDQMVPINGHAHGVKGGEGGKEKAYNSKWLGVNHFEERGAGKMQIPKFHSYRLI